MEGCKEIWKDVKKAETPEMAPFESPLTAVDVFVNLVGAGWGGGGVGKMCWELLPAGFALGCGALSMAGAVEFIIL